VNTFLENVLRYLPEPWRGLAVPFAVFVAVVALGLVVRRIAFARLRNWARSTSTRVDETLLDSLHGPALLWIIILGIYIATDISQLPRSVASWSERALLVLWIVSLTLAISKLASRLVRTYMPVGTLTEVLVTLLAGSIGALTLLRSFGIDITPFLTALGVGGLAVALALQDTLSNLFAGFYISVAGQIRVGDFIQLESGQRGYVTDIGWRSTTLRERANNLIVIPNNKLSQSTVTNFTLPDRPIALSIQVGVSIDSDIDKVEKVLADAVSTTEAPGLLKEPAPAVLLMPGFGERGLDFTIICHVANFEDQFRVQHEIRKTIVRLFRKEGIVIPRAPSA
jgi:small-conductance mechanosensitive channel